MYSLLPSEDKRRFVEFDHHYLLLHLRSRANPDSVEDSSEDKGKTLFEDDENWFLLLSLLL